MKTHEFAQALQVLARLLKAGPDVELSEVEMHNARALKTPHDIAVNLDTLVSLSSLGKNQWAELIAEYKFPIEVKRSYSSRDVMGKLFTYLEQNPDAREKLRVTSTRESGKASPELLRALNTLLKGSSSAPSQSGG